MPRHRTHHRLVNLAGLAACGLAVAAGAAAAAASVSDELAENLRHSLEAVPPAGAGWAVRRWDGGEGRFVCPAGDECAPRLSGSELIALAWEDHPTMVESPANSIILSAKRNLQQYWGPQFSRKDAMDVIAAFSTIDYHTGTSGDLRRDFEALDGELLKSEYMRDHQGAAAAEAHSNALQDYVILGELLRHPNYDWRPLPAPGGGPDSCRRDEILIQVLNLARSRERRKLVEASLAGGAGWRHEFFEAVDGRALLGEEGVLGEDAAHAVLEGHGLGLFRGWRLAKNDPKMRIVPNLMAEMPRPIGHSVTYWARDIRPGEVGCSMSYLRIWAGALERGLPQLAVLEDDHVPVAETWCELAEGLRALESLGMGWDVIYLDTGHWYGDSARLTDGADLPPHFTRLAASYATHALMFSARGIQRLSEGGLDRCLMPVDDYLFYMTNPVGHPRGTQIQACLGLAAPPADFVSLRWRGRPVVNALTEVALVSQIDEEAQEEMPPPVDDFPDEDDYEDEREL